MPVDLLIVLGGYLVGSLPFAHFVAARAGVELRNAGSGNVGATNVWRTVGPRPAAVAFVLDVAKGVGAVILAERLTSSPATVVATGVAAVVGHVYPVWLRFRGGKGVATSLGSFGALTPIPALIGCAAFAAVLWRTRVVAAASMVGAAAFTVSVLVLGDGPWTRAGALSCAVLILYSHRGNLGRLRGGTEARLGRPR